MSEADNVLLPAKWPNDWHISTVGAQFQIILGKMLDAEKNVGTARPYLGNRSVQWGQIDVTNLDLIKLTEGDLRKYRLEAGDLLVCEGGDIGRAAIWQDQLDECYFQKALHRLRPRGTYSSVLMRYLLEYYARTGFLTNFATQTSIAHLPKDKFVTVPLPLPPLYEQQAIAAALSDADGVVAGLERVIAKKRLIKQGAMQDLLTARRRLPGFSGEWEVKKMGELLANVTGGGTPSRTRAEFWNGPIPWMTVKDFATGSIRGTLESITTEGLKNSASSLVDAGTLILCTRMAVGKTAIMDVDVAINQDLKALVFKPGISSVFVKRMFELMQKQIEDSAGGSTVKGISIGDVRAMEFPLPSTDEQDAIATVLSDMDSEIQTLESRLAKARAVKEGMMQNLLTGRVRLV